MWNLIFFKDANELIYKTEVDLQIWKTNLWLPKGKQGNKSGAQDEHTHTTIYKIDNRQGHTVQHRELYSIFCDKLKEKTT